MAVAIKDAVHENRLYEMTSTMPTALWNDSCALSELGPAIEEFGAVGATCNPAILLEVLKKEANLWKDRIPALAHEYPTATEDQLGWRLAEEVSVKAAKLLEPIFEKTNGRNGRLSIQTDPRFYRDTEAIVAQARHFNDLAPNMIVKIPATRAGIAAIEEATRQGVSINATVSFSVPQAIAVAEAVERGLDARTAAGEPIDTMGPVCTIMVGRLDDWMKVVAEKEGIAVNPAALEWAGVAAMKHAYSLYQARGYRLRLLAAAFRNRLHWSEFMGGDVVISPPYKWQQRLAASDVAVGPRMDNPVDSEILNELYTKFADFRRAYDEDGMTIAEFDSFGPTVRTLRQFLKANVEMQSLMRDMLLPNPDL
jgi:transaldolase